LPDLPGQQHPVLCGNLAEAGSPKPDTAPSKKLVIRNLGPFVTAHIPLAPLDRGDFSGTLRHMDRLPASLAFFLLLFSGWINRQ
jgi:hypothetical protein